MKTASPEVTAQPVSPALAIVARMSRWEWLCAGLAIAAGWCAFIIISGGSMLVARKMWLDEICSWMLISDPSLSHAMDALLHGADTNPPALYLILRGLHVLGMPLNEVALRLFAVASNALGMLGCYGLLRLVFDRVTCAAALVALLAGDVVIDNVYQARFYDPWFATCAWFCFALAVRRAGSGLIAALAVAALGPLMLTVHYFGLFSFLLIVAADFLADTRRLGVRVGSRWPLLTCLPALAVVVYFYVHQKAAFTVWSTWIEPSQWNNSLLFLRSTMFVWMFLSLGCFWAVAWWLRRVQPVWRTGRLPSLRPLAGLLSLALLPLAVLLFSVLVQPAGVARYALPGAGGIAALAAVGLSRLRPALVLTLATGWLVAGGLRLHADAGKARHDGEELAAVCQRIAAAPANERVIFERWTYYPMFLYAPQYRDRMFVLDFATGEDADDVLAPTPALAYVGRDASRAVARSYPLFAMMTRGELPAGQPFLFGAADANVERIERRFHTPMVKHIDGNFFEVTLE